MHIRSLPHYHFYYPAAREATPAKQPTNALNLSSWLAESRDLIVMTLMQASDETI
jgi:hypothetical protein